MAGCIRAYHNVSNDTLTRLGRPGVEELIQKHGLLRLDGSAEWKEAFELGGVHRAITWKALGGAWELAFQLR